MGGEYKTLIYEPGIVTKIIHNEPEKTNAMGAEFQTEFLDAMNKFETDREARVAVSLSNGKHFSAGHDIAILSTKQPWKAGEKTEWGEPKWRRVNNPRTWAYPVWECSKPLVAGVRGAALAAGAMFALFHDIIVMGETSYMGFEITRVSGAFGGMLQMWLGYRKAFELLATGWNISSQELYRLGAVNKVVTDDNVDAEALKYAEIIALMPPETVMLSKMSLKLGMGLMGAKEQIWHNEEVNTLVHCVDNEQEKEFYRIMKEEGMRAALEFRDAPFEKYGYSRHKANSI